jgi:hypothetical protein
MAFGRSKAIKLYKRWGDSKDKTGSGARDFVDHSTSDIDTLKLFWTTTEDKFVNVKAVSTASRTTHEDGSNVSPGTCKPQSVKVRSPMLSSNRNNSPSPGSELPASKVSNKVGTPKMSNTKKPPSASTTGSNRNEARSNKSLSTQSHTGPSVTSTSNGFNNGSARVLFNPKNPPSHGTELAAYKGSNEGGTPGSSNPKKTPPRSFRQVK